jgi:ABC-2 type transport system ATP-binding protein
VTAQTSQEPAIALVDLSKVYSGKRGTRIQALKGITLTVRQGEVFGFLGPNGAGKSTTIKSIMGLINPSSGIVSILGQPAFTPSSRKPVGFLPENPSFYDTLTAEEYLLFVGRSHGMKGVVLSEATDRVLKLLEIWDVRKRQLRSYSKGMVQRVGIAQALVHDPAILVLDEPMSGLDPLGRALVKEIILDLKSRGKTVFFSTHIIADVEEVCDRVGVILKGELKVVEEVREVVAAGVHGYRMKIRDTETNEMEEITVDRQSLSTYLHGLPPRKEILQMEPLRRDLEAFFLELVKGGAAPGPEAM